MQGSNVAICKQVQFEHETPANSNAYFMFCDRCAILISMPLWQSNNSHEICLNMHAKTGCNVTVSVTTSGKAKMYVISFRACVVEQGLAEADQ